MFLIIEGYCDHESSGVGDGVRVRCFFGPLGRLELASTALRWRLGTLDGTKALGPLFHYYECTLTSPNFPESHQPNDMLFPLHLQCTLSTKFLTLRSIHPSWFNALSYS